MLFLVFARLQPNNPIIFVLAYRSLFSACMSINQLEYLIVTLVPKVNESVLSGGQSLSLDIDSFDSNTAYTRSLSPDTMGIAPRMPIKLVKPSRKSAQDQSQREPWGLAATKSASQICRL